ncbi:hypothetical protein HDU76_006160, partial [Blyttiomyces sp. JEL0837]
TYNTHLGKMLTATNPANPPANPTVSVTASSSANASLTDKTLPPTPSPFDQDPTHLDTLAELLENNRQWADRIREENPGLLERLSIQQTPEILWIGCSDARVPAENIVGLGPGDLFVHRNIAN